MKIALLTGGPSLERGIALNSARSVLDHLEGGGIELVPIYFDQQKRAYEISKAQLYSSTPSDFDFKLEKTAKFLGKRALASLLKSVDLAFPVMHGAFGEDGGIQRILERLKVPYVGSPAAACRRCSDKFEANEFIRERGFFAPPSMVLKIYHDDHLKRLKAFFKEHRLKRAIVKPATGGSSIGVFSVATAEKALEKAQILFGKRMDTRVVVEPFCEGTEFTVILFENRHGMPVAVLPTEIETDYEGHQIFDFRKKYLPTRQVRYHCPPRFDNATIERIQVQAEQLFKVLGMRDFARFDGWLMPDGNLWFSDFNPISGMEQNSFLFQQGSRIGLSHGDVLRLIVSRAAERAGLEMPVKEMHSKKKNPVRVLFGGETSERQVSLMSGTNAWLKLRKSEHYEPLPFLLDLKGRVWNLPYALTLNHTVEEVLENCEAAEESEQRLADLVAKVRWRLALPESAFSEPFFVPRSQSLNDFIRDAKFVFIGLHGGIGENGILQGMLTKAGVKFNGSGEAASELCMDKFDTGQALQGLESEGIFVARKVAVDVRELKGEKTADLWINWTRELGARTLIVKPRSEGCSSGVVRLFDAADLKAYLRHVEAGSHSIPAGTFKNQKDPVEMPPERMTELLLEPFIRTDVVRVKGQKLKWKKVEGWVEVTVGVLEEKGRVHALNPSLTVAEGEVLSVEEKFQGGTGINLTPPPEEFVSAKVLAKAKKSAEKVAQVLGIEGYCRMDLFMKVDSGDICVIEINSTPALTPSTVLYHQALAEVRPIYPLEFLETLIQNKGY